MATNSIAISKHVEAISFWQGTGGVLALADFASFLPLSQQREYSNGSPKELLLRLAYASQI